VSGSQVLPQKLFEKLSSAAILMVILQGLGGTYNLHDFSIGAAELLDALSGNALGEFAAKKNEKRSLVCCKCHVMVPYSKETL
jgi:hypothetical protein